ncbi:MAG: TonB-dependent receptor domain-containing protein, partial [Caulobacteraceae bacterium]
SVSAFPSQDLRESQSEASQYAVASYLRDSGALTLQASLYGRYSTLQFKPDEIGDILFNGVAQTAGKEDVDAGVQIDATYRLNERHTLRAGVLLDVDHAISATRSGVLLIDDDPASPGFGQETSQTPFVIVDDTAATAQTYSAYLQDEWKLAQSLTLNAGLRFDLFDGFRSEHQLSPRLNLVWSATPSTTVHVGYARYFSPPPFELVGGETVAKFVQPLPGNPAVTSTGSPVVAACGQLVATTACPLVSADTTPFAERANYFDVGAEQKVGRGLTVSLDSYLKLSKNLVDEGQFGAPVILTPFNYARGRQYGVELSASYERGPLSAYGNVAYSVAQGEDWISSQFSFSQAALDYVAGHYVYLDHDERITASAGASYLWRGTRFGGDLIVGSGLRADEPVAPVTEPGGSVLAAIPNGEELPAYAQLNLAVSHRFERVAGGPLEVRLDVINALDAVYQIRNGAGIGVFAPQYGPRRGFFVGVTKDF